MLRNDQDGLLGELIAQQLPHSVAHLVRQGGTIAFGRRVREAIQAQGWTLDGGGKARVDSEWLASVLAMLDEGQAQVGRHRSAPVEAMAWVRLSKAVDSKNRGQG